MTPQSLVIQPGTVLIREGTAWPDGVQFATRAFIPGWQAVEGSTSAQIDRAINKAGWHFFYLAAELQESALGRELQTAIDKAVRKLAAVVERDSRNALEITGVRIRRLPGLFYVTLKAHARHIKDTPFLFDAPRYSPWIPARHSAARAQAA